MTVPASNRRAIAIWLFICCALIFAMVVLGGVTRLTRSGLSIVEWRPVTGIVPPLTDERWQIEFKKYQRTPEYQKVNQGMTLAGFKSIYWVEYAHRLLGRIIGFVVLLPLLYFGVRRRIDGALARRLSVAFALGGAQAGIGWLMVASGLRDNPHVSPYWLVAHLVMALFIYGWLLWTALDLWWPAPASPTSAMPLEVSVFAYALLTLVVMTVIAGGFVAGTRAGFAFNSFPLMNGQFIPDGAYATTPLWRDWFENVATVQFHHRILAYATLFVGVQTWWKARRAPISRRARAAVHALFAALWLQIGLGIATLLTVVPVALGAAHQAGALLLLTAALALIHALRR